MPNNNPSKLAHLRMPDYSGSWWRIPYADITSMRIGKFTPFRPVDLPGGGLYKLKPSIRFDSMPAVSPLYGGFTMRTKFYFAPYRLYLPELRRNRQLPWNSIPQIELPRLSYTRNFGQSVREPFDVSFAGSLLQRLGMGWGEFASGQSFGNRQYSQTNLNNSEVGELSTNMLPLLAYIDAWMYGEYNPQDKNIPVDYDVTGEYVSQSERHFERKYTRRFVNYDNLRARMDQIIYGINLPYGMQESTNQAVWKGEGSSYSPVSKTPKLVFSVEKSEFVPGYSLYSRVNPTSSVSSSTLLYQNWDYIVNSNSAVGLLPVTYKGDRFSSWYSEEGINILKDYIVTNGETFLSLRKRNDDFMVAALSLISGNRYVDYLQYIFDQELELKDHPIMVGYDEQHFGMIDVLAQSNTGDGQNGFLGARASMAREYNDQVKPISFKTKEPGLLLVCSSIVPSVTYYRGSDRFMFARKVEDLWQPPYSSQGFMETFRGEYLNPFAMSDVDSLQDDYINQSIRPSESPLPGGLNSWSELNKLATQYVPLGWQYMSGYQTISGAVLTNAFKTWTNRKDDSQLTGYAVSGSTAGNIEVTNDYFNPFYEFGLDVLSSTYVDSNLFNDNFVNISRAERENFIVMLDMPITAYQPISKTLITKTF